MRYELSPVIFVESILNFSHLPCSYRIVFIYEIAEIYEFVAVIDICFPLIVAWYIANPCNPA